MEFTVAGPFCVDLKSFKFTIKRMDEEEVDVLEVDEDEEEEDAVSPAAVFAVGSSSGFLEISGLVAK